MHPGDWEDFHLLISIPKKPHCFLVFLAPLSVFMVLVADGRLPCSDCASAYSKLNCVSVHWQEAPCHEFETCWMCNGAHVSHDTSSGLKIDVRRVYMCSGVYMYSDGQVNSVKRI